MHFRAPSRAARPAARRRARRESAKKKDVRLMNIEAAKAVADAIRTSLGPRGMDKMVRPRAALLLCRDPWF